MAAKFSGEELAGDDESIAAVVALSADDDDAVLRQRGEGLMKKIDDPAAGILHQDEAGDATLDGEAIDFAHFGSGQDLHGTIIACGGEA